MKQTNLSTRNMCVSLADRWLFAVCSQQLSFQGAGGGITMGNKQQNRIMESANAEKSEPLAHGIRLPPVEGMQVLEQSVSSWLC